MELTLRRVRREREEGRDGEREGEREKTLLELSKRDKEDCDYRGHKYSCCIQASEHR